MANAVDSPPPRSTYIVALPAIWLFHSRSRGAVSMAYMCVHTAHVLQVCRYVVSQVNQPFSIRGTLATDL